MILSKLNTHGSIDVMINSLVSQFVIKYMEENNIFLENNWFEWWDSWLIG